MSRQLKMAAPDVHRQIRHRPFFHGQRKFRRSRILPLQRFPFLFFLRKGIPDGLRVERLGILRQGENSICAKNCCTRLGPFGFSALRVGQVIEVQAKQCRPIAGTFRRVVRFADAFRGPNLVRQNHFIQTPLEVDISINPLTH